MIRDKEHADFIAAESELADTIDTLDRAIVILEREMAKNPALLQKKVDASNMQNVLQVLNTVIDATALTTMDKQKLVALVQNKQGDEDNMDEMGAPAAAVYKSHSSSIVEVLEDMKDKAEETLADTRKAESNAAHNFDMTKQSLEDQMAADNKDLGEAKSAKASAAETKATAEGDLAMSVKDLANAEAQLETLNTDCTTAADDHESSMKNRAEELKVIAEAKEIITSSSGGAVDQVYFLQVAKAYTTAKISRSSTLATMTAHSKLHTSADLVNMEIVAMLKKLAKEQHSAPLVQLASRISAVMRYGVASGEDPFAKVKSLITELIDKLEAEAKSEASQKAYCDEEMAKTAEKKAELNADIDKLTSKIDVAAARSAKLKEEVADLNKELADLTKLQAEMDTTRADEHKAYTTAKSDLEQGISGVQHALEILRDYYGGASLIQGSKLEPAPELAPMHSKAEGAGQSIIGILEVIESDFSKSLAEETVAEEQAASSYEKTTQENKISKAMKEQDVKYKTQESTSLDKEIAEMTSDKEGLISELSAVLEYGEKLVEMCVAKPETYEERSKRRQAEIAGLKEALKYLEGAALLQEHRHGRRSLRYTPVK